MYQSVKRFLLAFATLFAGLVAYAQVTTATLNGKITINLDN